MGTPAQQAIRLAVSDYLEELYWCDEWGTRHNHEDADYVCLVFETEKVILEIKEFQSLNLSFLLKPSAT